VKVALGGDGGDEVFLGYPTYAAHRLAALYERLPPGVRGLVQSGVDALPVSFENISLDFKLRRFVAGAEYPPPVRNAVWLGSFAPEAAAAVLSPEARAALPPGTDGTELLDELLAGVHVKHPLEAIQYLDMKMYMSDDILVKVDRASMACSLEVRAPLLDYELVDFVARLPVDYKLHGLVGKALLKRATEGLLPDSIRLRAKKGFGIPVARWIRDELAGPVRAALDPVRLKREGLFDPQEVQRYLREHHSGQRDHRKALWTLFMFQSWLERHGPRAVSPA
jgi:asparagine synthase (glutamine-hydrolysing)